MQRSGTVATVVALALVTGCSDAITGGGAPLQAVTLQTQQLAVVDAEYSGYTTAEHTVITDAATWVAAWERIHSYLVEAPPVPAVDFASEAVILVAMGARPTSGYSVRITTVQSHDNTLYVTLRERSPAANCVLLQALTSPVHAVKVQRTATRAEFTTVRETYSC